MKRGLLLAALVFLSALPASAQNDGSSTMPGAPDMSAGRHHAKSRLEPDTNGDNLISRAEWLAQFDKVDANHDGFVSVQEAVASQHLNSALREKLQQGQTPTQLEQPDAPDGPDYEE